MIRRTVLMTGVLVAALGLAFATPAHGQEYGGCNATASDTDVSPGDTITIEGSGASAGGTVTASIDGAVVGSGTADASGNFSFDVTIPATASGSEQLTVDCGGTANVAGITLTVSGTAPTDGATDDDELPRTGDQSTGPAAALAIALIGAGGLAYVAARAIKAAAVK
jgi:LPXTG-motif cell wall-anchored protein